MRDRSRVLVVAPYLPSRRSGGQVRLRGLVRGLTTSHAVSLLTFEGPESEHGADLEAARELCADVVTVPGDRIGLARASKRALQVRSLVSARSFARLVHERPAMQAAIDRMTERTPFDVVHVETSLMAQFAYPRSAAVVLDEQNIEYEILHRTVAVSGALPRKLYSYVDGLKLRAEERRAWRSVDACAVASSRDEQTIRRAYPNALTAVVPNAADTEYFVPSHAPTEPFTLLFFGTLGYYPNTDAMLFFLDLIMPLLRRSIPSVRLVIVGSSPPPEVVRRAGPDVVVEGAVADVRPYLERARAVVVPLRIGGGTRLKILEAMAMGKPVVSTSLGAEGLSVRDGRDLILADSASDLASSLARVLVDDDLAAALGYAARRLVETSYDWFASVRRLESLYASALLARSRALHAA